jgi:hypothetical protein
MRAFLLASLFASAAAAQTPAAQPDWIAQYEQLWKVRDQKGVEAQLHKVLKGALAQNPQDFEANWRLAALLDWQSDGADGDLKGPLGKAAWQAADKAVAARPDDVRGYYYSGTGIGLYSEGVGILTALGEGLEGKFRDRVQTALKLDKDFLDGAPQVLWGRYFFRLPWPKRNVDESVKVLSAAVKDHPRNLRAKIYLADALLDQGHGDEAKKLIADVLAAPPSQDAPEDRRLKALASDWQRQHH